MEAIYCPPAKRTAPLLSTDGRTPLTEKTQILQRLAEQLRGVLKCQMKTNTNLDLPLFLHETIRTVQQLSSGKAPASDASSAEVCKHDCPKFMEHLTALFQETRRQGEVAQDFKDTTIIHLYKRIENHQVCDNHRGICLLNIAARRTGRVSPLTLAAGSVRSLLDNPRSNRPERRTALVARELARYKLDIIAISDTRFSEQGQLEEVAAGYTFFCSGRYRAKRQDTGVTFAIRNDIVGRLPWLPRASSIA
ncbi:hypothetical protein SprV_1002877700 [Sparganum proliferum]